MLKKITVLAGTVLFAGCVSQIAPPEAYLPAPIPHYDVPAQVIYRIDDHRFISLENYSDCHHGTTYYNDTRQGIRTELGRADIENYQGRLINADPTGRNIVIPGSEPPQFACPDKGCRVSFAYSTDGGRTFKGEWYMSNTQSPYRDSSKYIIAATTDRMYVARKVSDTVDDYGVDQYPLIPGIDFRKEYPPSVRGDSFLASKRPDYLKGLRTPSGQEYLSCDDSIRPKNLPSKK